MADISRRGLLKGIGAGALMLSMGYPAQALASDDYTIDDFVAVNDDNYQSAVVEASEDKPVVVLFDSSCPGNDFGARGAKNLQDVLIELKEKYGNKIKFCRYDRCGSTQNDLDRIEETYGEGTSIIVTVIYNDGEELIRKKNSFDDEKAHDAWVRGFSKKLDSILEE